MSSISIPPSEDDGPPGIVRSMSMSGSLSSDASAYSATSDDDSTEASAPSKGVTAVELAGKWRLESPAEQVAPVSDREEQSGANEPERHSGRRRSSGLSQALKDGTQESHEAAEGVHFVSNFIKGQIDRDLYSELVTGLYHTYVALERLLDEHGPTHFPALHFPRELGRTESLREDMEFWHGSRWEGRTECSSPSPAVRDYVRRMEEAARRDPLLLVSHAYTRYLGDLSGGKVLGRVARRAMDLDGHEGLRFYEFERVGSAKLFKDAYRRALDSLELTSGQVRRLVAEANVAFALNMRVFEELDVRGGVPGARVRDVREALAYHDLHAAPPALRDGGGEAKCPFGFTGGANPHAPPSTERLSPEGKGRCPWPFILLHDPAAGARDWQTWFVVGALLCYSSLP